MDRLISEQYLIEHLKACFENGRPMYRPTLDEVSEMIKAIPSADLDLKQSFIEQAYMKGREDGVNDFIKKSLIDE